MSIESASLLYNGTMVLLLSAAILWFVQRRHWLRFISGLFTLTFVAACVAVVMSMPEWNPLRAARLLCFGWFLHVPLFLLSCCWFAQQKALRWVCVGLVTIVAVNAIFAFRVEPYRLELTHYQVTSSKLTRPIKVCLLADFQTDKFEVYERRCLRRLMKEQPDLILMAGDYLQANSQGDWEYLRDGMNAFLHRINFGAPLGVYGVGGNTDFRRWPEIFRDRHVTVFADTKTVETSDFVLSGLSVEDSFDTDLKLPIASAAGGTPFHIVLGHAPDFSLSRDLQADLLLAGHTHGGQVRLPFFGPLVTFSQVPRSWASGLTAIGEGKTLVVSRGVGMERRDAPRLRYLCRPQLVFIELVPQRSGL